jgi:hypothetical protein
MARRRTGMLLAGLVAALGSVLMIQAPSHGEDAGPVVAGTFSGQLKLTKSWLPGGWGFEPGPRTYSFGKGCPTGSACTITKTDGAPQALTPQGGALGWSGSDPVACIDNVTGKVSTEHGFDYTYKVRLVPAGTTTRDGVTYVSALRGTYEGKLAVNGTGRAFDCLVNPNRTSSETERAVYDLKLEPLAAPKPIVASPPLGITPAVTTALGSVPGFTLPQSERQRASAESVAAGRRSSVPGSLVVPSEAFRNLGSRLPQDLLLVALLGLLMIFPAQIFNSTYEDNHERIDRQLARLRLRRRAPTGPPGPADAPPSRNRRLVVFAGCAVIGSLLGGLLDPGLGATTASYALVVGLFAALVLSVLVTAFTGRQFRSVTHHGHGWYLRAIPSALLIAVLCVVVSRVTHFEPGYLYGVLGGAVFATSLDRRSEGRAEVAVSVVALVLALGAWLVFAPVAAAADGTDPGFLLLTTDSFLAALFIGGIEGLLFGLVPLRFLPGYRIRGWNWVAWGAMTAVVLFTFVHVLLMPQAGYLGRSTAASVQLTVALFVAFAVVSGLFWLYFRLRPSTTASPEEPGAEVVGVPDDPTPEGATPGPRRREVPAGRIPGAQPTVPSQGRPQDGEE